MSQFLYLTSTSALTASRLTSIPLLYVFEVATSRLHQSPFSTLLKWLHSDFHQSPFSTLLKWLHSDFHQSPTFLRWLHPDFHQSPLGLLYFTYIVMTSFCRNSLPYPQGHQYLASASVTIPAPSVKIVSRRTASFHLPIYTWFPQLYSEFLSPCIHFISFPSFNRLITGTSIPIPLPRNAFSVSSHPNLS